jgi:asparagine synthase (glutamine-hydrolysing)
MCGINGIFAFNPSANLPDRRELLATRDHMRARGPDAEGEWWDATRRIGLGHRRLSIIDLSERATQPMASACGRYQVTFNGEIYNYPELRTRLEAQGRVFRTTSDTEVLLHLFELKREAMVHDLRGMFAFAIWDDVAKRLFLARDSYGIKPLYIASDGWTFRFASQVKALLAGGKVSTDPESAGIVGFHIWGSVPEPFTLYREIRALPAGHTQVIDEAGPREPQPFALVSDMLGKASPRPMAIDDMRECLRNALRESVKAHLLADVEVGLFLSAGVDSGALLGLMRDAGQQKIRTITLSFSEYEGTSDNETPLASLVARQYGAEHQVRTVDEAEFQRDLPAILTAMDQPTIDGINSWFVSKAASEAGLKVALSGLGGDELLGGYPSFRDIPRWVGMFKVPAAVPGLAWLARSVMSHSALGRGNPKARGMVKYGGSYAGAYLLRRGLFLPFELDTILDPELVRDGLERLQLLPTVDSTMPASARSPTARVAALESANYMRNQLLRDTDWTSMAHSIEVRTPLVDVALLQSVAPMIPQLTGTLGKQLLAQAPSAPLPDAVVNRPKTGFNVPVGSWLDRKPDFDTALRGHVSRHRALDLMRTFTTGASALAH